MTAMGLTTSQSYGAVHLLIEELGGSMWVVGGDNNVTHQITWASRVGHSCSSSAAVPGNGGCMGYGGL
jgi:hypothetical protein